MSAHVELTKLLDKQRKTHSSGGASSETISAANNTFDYRELRELMHACDAMGYQLVLNAGVLTIQPRS